MPVETLNTDFASLGSVPAINQAVASRSLTVLVIRWWEFFRDGEPGRRFIEVLHQTAEHLASDPQIRVISFAEVRI